MKRDDYIWRMEHIYWDDDWDDRIEERMARDAYGGWLDGPDAMTLSQADMYYRWACEDEIEKKDLEEDERAQLIAERAAV